jgi:raffinose/stachyose/melibiose transport system substrate-binding protein
MSVRKPLIFLLAFFILAITAFLYPRTPEKQKQSEPVVLEETPEITLKVMTNRVDLIENGTMKAYADRFKAMHPGTSVQFVGLTNYVSDIMVGLSTGDTGDVLLIPNTITIPDLENYFEPLDDAMFDGLRFSDFLTYRGKRYGVPTGAVTDGIVYNKKAFREAGISKLPQTLDEFYEACEKLKQVGIVPIYLNYGAQWPMKQWGDNLVSYMTGDPDFLNLMAFQDEPWQMDNPWGDAVRIVQTLIQNGYVEQELLSNQWETSKSEIARGHAGMALLGNWFIKQVIDAGADPRDIGFFPFPYNKSPSHYAPLTPDWSIGVSKLSRNKTLAKEWIRFFVKESGYVDDSGFIPVDLSKEASLSQLQEFFSYEPTFIESKPPTELFLDIANEARIFFWTGDFMQDLAVSGSPQELFQSLNLRWKQAKQELNNR